MLANCFLLFDFFYGSFRKSNNVQGEQSRVNLPAVSSSDSANFSASRNVQNGAHAQSSLHGMV